MGEGKGEESPYDITLRQKGNADKCTRLRLFVQLGEFFVQLGEFFVQLGDFFKFNSDKLL